ncbi:MAG TPA: Panacea domain-containing protein [Xanthobacteraceae bacterium]
MTENLDVNVTYRVNLSGGQQRLKEAILYAAERGQGMVHFGRTKLHKIIWRADFRSFYERHQPVTGRMYQKLEWGPALVEMVPVMQELRRSGCLQEERRVHGDKEEFRPIATVKAMLRLFSPEDIEFLDESLRHYWDMTGTETSDDSHGIAWKTRNLGDPIPYEASYFNDDSLPQKTLNRLAEIAKSHGLRSI